MNKSPAREALEIEVTDFGPIVEAKIDLRPLTVFVGSSNTGKSYLAILIYALHRHFAIGARFTVGNAQWRSPMLFRRSTSNISEDAIDDLKGIVNDLIMLRRGNFTVTLSNAVISAMRAEFATRMKFLGREMARCFGINNIATLTRREKVGGARLVLRRKISNSLDPFEHALTLGAKRLTSSTAIPKGISVNLPGDEDWEIYFSPDDDDEHHNVPEIFDWIFGELTDIFSGPLRRSAFYLPADRTGVMHAHNVVVDALIERAAMTGIESGTVQSPMFSGVLADFLRQLIAIGGSQRRGRKRGPKIPTTIEDKILGGSIEVERSGAIKYPRFTYLPSDWAKNSPLPLMNASSMVSELAPVVLYLRHIVERGDVLIVEEPESHLHPAMQVEFTRQIATLVQSGVRVIVTTHSEWLLEELANIVKRSEIPGKGRHGASIRAPSLSPEDVGVWLFERRNRPRGSKVTEIKLGESGLYPSGFGKVAKALHNEWADISSRIGEST